MNNLLIPFMYPFTKLTGEMITEWPFLFRRNIIYLYVGQSNITPCDSSVNERQKYSSGIIFELLPSSE